MKILNLMILSFLVTLFPIESYSTVATEKIIIEHQKTPLEISLKAVLLTDTEWTTSIIANEFKRTNDIFLQCGVQIKEIDIIRSTFPSVINDSNDLVDFMESLKEIGFRSINESIVIFAGKIDGNLLASIGGQPGGFSLRSPNPEAQDLWMNVAVLLDLAHTQEYKRFRDVNYTPLAHELGHIFLNHGHVDYPNLLGSSPLLVNTELTKDQCQSLRKSPALLPLLLN